jgi:hypothetical protein
VQSFISHLRAIQAGTSDREFSARLGVSRAHWVRIRAGTRPVTLNVARAAIAIWPEFEELYINEIRAQLHTGTPTASAQE